MFFSPAGCHSDQSVVFVSYDDGGDDRLSPEICDCVSLNCHVDLDSLWMVSWGDHRNVETGSRTGVSHWRSILCCAALLSRMPEFPDTGCLNCFRDVGKNCVLDLSTRGTYPRVRPPECGLEMLAQTPPILYCRVVEVPSVAIMQSRGCTRMRGCVGNGHSLAETQDAREVGVSPGEMECMEDSAYIRPDSVVESPGGCLHYYFDPAARYVLGTRLGLYDLVDDIPDVMGFRALQPSAAIVKVMSGPDSRCVRVMIM